MGMRGKNAKFPDGPDYEIIAPPEGGKVMVRRLDTGFEGRMPIQRFQTEIAGSVAGGAIGAGAGFLDDSEGEDGTMQAGLDPLSGFLMGSAGGAVAGRGMNLARLQEPAHDLGKRLLNTYRSMLLMSKNLPANAIGAPLGTTAP